MDVLACAGNAECFVMTIAADQRIFIADFPNTTGTDRSREFFDR